MIKVLKYNSEAIINVFIADSFSKRLFGYMFRKEPHHDAILLKPCDSIHTFFMKFNIDVLFLNEHMQIIKKIESLRPGQVVTKVRGAKIVIESKEGVFNNIKEGHRLDI
ncbi:DUF192 domain-containing protein [Clostridium algoriphilum]|uniref:DUF192 domain-containing protein n=1 Tax=Clostridium algoriphilum TaxID=198347 RepID=UPI001CF5A98B|nr:DUF192 domain-containing protein [Clostridium algoriphilum]MCB2294211.1 DUF192 domain-containing protein [Clostridium algoriphilum]